MERKVLASKSGLVQFNKKGPAGLSWIAYPAGIYDENTEYRSTEKSTPMVILGSGENAQRYVMCRIDTWLGVNRGMTPAEDYALNGKNATWTLIEKYQAVDIGMAIIDFGIIGRMVFFGDYIFSISGTDETGSPSEDYHLFDPALIGQANAPFTPNLALDFKRGKIWHSPDNQCGISNVPVITQNMINPSNVAFGCVNILCDCTEDVMLPDDEKYVGVQFLLINTHQADRISGTMIDDNIVSIYKKRNIPGGGISPKYIGSYIHYKGYHMHRVWMFQKGSYLRLLCCKDENGDIIYRVIGHSDNFVFFNANYCGEGTCQIYGNCFCDRPYSLLPMIQFFSLDELFGKLSNFKFGNNFENL